MSSAFVVCALLNKFKKTFLTPCIVYDVLCCLSYLSVYTAYMKKRRVIQVVNRDNNDTDAFVERIPSNDDVDGERVVTDNISDNVEEDTDENDNDNHPPVTSVGIDGIHWRLNAESPCFCKKKKCLIGTVDPVRRKVPKTAAWAVLDDGYPIKTKNADGKPLTEKEILDIINDPRNDFNGCARIPCLSPQAKILTKSYVVPVAALTPSELKRHVSVLNFVKVEQHVAKMMRIRRHGKEASVEMSRILMNPKTDKPQTLVMPVQYGLHHVGQPEVDKRHVGERIDEDVEFNGTLWIDDEKSNFDQWTAMAVIMRRVRIRKCGGLICLATGTGKTRMVCMIISIMRGRAIVSCNSSLTWQQHWPDEFKTCLPNARVAKLRGHGKISEKKMKEIEECDVLLLMHRSWAMGEYPTEIMQRFHCVFVDEVHLTGADQAQNMLQYAARHPYVFGLSGTMKRKDGCDRIFPWLMGPILYHGPKATKMSKYTRVLPVQFMTGKQIIRTREVLDVRGQPQQETDFSATVSELLLNDDARNLLILWYITLLLVMGRYIIVFSDSVEHAKLLQRLCLRSPDIRWLMMYRRMLDTDEMVDRTFKYLHKWHRTIGMKIENDSSSSSSSWPAPRSFPNCTRNQCQENRCWILTNSMAFVKRMISEQLSNVTLLVDIVFRYMSPQASECKEWMVHFRGDTKPEERERIVRTPRSILFATYAILSTGANISWLNTQLWASPRQDETILNQALGRLRPGSDGWISEACPPLCVDIRDPHGPFARHAIVRNKVQLAKGVRMLPPDIIVSVSHLSTNEENTCSILVGEDAKKSGSSVASTNVNVSDNKTTKKRKLEPSKTNDVDDDLEVQKVKKAKTETMIKTSATTVKTTPAGKTIKVKKKAIKKDVSESKTVKAPKKKTVTEKSIKNGATEAKTVQVKKKSLKQTTKKSAVTLNGDDDGDRNDNDNQRLVVSDLTRVKIVKRPMAILPAISPSTTTVSATSQVSDSTTVESSKKRKLTDWLIRQPEMTVDTTIKRTCM